jgi:hypothetical protein
VRCNARFTVTLPALAAAARWSFVLRARNAGRRVAVVTRSLTLSAPPFDVSPNWSGYVVRSSVPLTQVSGQFTVPSLNCTDTNNAGESEWVGVGGAGGTSGDLLQTGVRSDCIGGVQYDDAGWWEEAPEYPEADFHSMSVSAGDTMQATVWQDATSGAWSTQLDDLTTGVSGVMTTGIGYGTVLDSNPTVWQVEEGSTAGVSYAGGYTAEWIVEDYELSGALVPLADFGTITFAGLSTSLSSWGLTSDEQVGIGDDGGYLHAAPTAPDSTGDGFSVTYTG